MLTEEQKTLITAHSAGMVATVNADGTPSVSPKATFVIVDDTTLAFGDIRSPATVANLRQRPAVEICFIDVICRKAVRVTGVAQIVRVSEADQTLLSAFETSWTPYLAHMKHLVKIDVTTASLITSPAYDIGHTEDELRKINLDRLIALSN